MRKVHGLTRKEMEALFQTFRKHEAMLLKVVLFGSRARGDHQDTADIDLAVFTRDDAANLLSLREDLDRADIIQTVDVVHYNTITSDRLRDEIKAEGIVLYAAAEEGGAPQMAHQLDYKLQDFQKALKKLQESLARDPHADDLVLDAAIQRFEFTYELGWKLMKAYLKYQGNQEAVNPRSVIREGYREGLVSQGEAWLTMLQDRNMTARTFDEETAWTIWENIKGTHVKALEAFAMEMADRVSALKEERL